MKIRAIYQFFAPDVWHPLYTAPEGQPLEVPEQEFASVDDLVRTLASAMRPRIIAEKRAAYFRGLFAGTLYGSVVAVVALLVFLHFN